MELKLQISLGKWFILLMNKRTDAKVMVSKHESELSPFVIVY